MSIILFDLDNTLCDMDHRLHLVRGPNPDWDAFEAQCVHDTLIVPTAETLIAYQNIGHRIWLWTGRSDGVKKQTENWLHTYAIPYHQLLMRPYGWQGPTELLKKRWAQDDPVPFDQILCCYDDDPDVVAVLRSIHLHVFQVMRPE